MGPWLRALVLATLAVVFPSAGSGQPLGVLHITVVLTNAERTTTPVAHHALLVSDNPATSSSR